MVNLVRSRTVSMAESVVQNGTAGRGAGAAQKVA